MRNINWFVFCGKKTLGKNLKTFG